MAGRMAERRLGPRPAERLDHPVAGTHLSSTANTSTSSTAATNVGIESMANEAELEVRSSAPFGRSAEKSASGTATTMAMSWERMINSRSIGMAVAMALATVWCVIKDWPRFPWNWLPSHTLYWCKSEELRPSCFSSAARAVGVSLGPRMVRVGSPGSRWTSKKARIEITKTITTSWIRRLPT